MGCGIACLAMLTGRTYAEARDWVDKSHPQLWRESGIGWAAIDHLLAWEGFAVARRHYASGQFSEPFTPVSLCQVYVTGDLDSSHYVVMLADGSVLDPAFPDKTRMTDYGRVVCVCAVVPLTKE